MTWRLSWRVRRTAETRCCGRRACRPRKGGTMSEIADKPELLPFTPGKLPEISAEDRKRPIWEVLIERAQQVPEEELDKIPHDGSINHDHYLYGAPKKQV